MGIVFAPLSLDVLVKNGPMAGLYFSPVRVTIAGAVHCIGGACPVGLKVRRYNYMLATFCLREKMIRNIPELNPALKGRTNAAPAPPKKKNLLPIYLRKSINYSIFMIFFVFVEKAFVL